MSSSTRTCIGCRQRAPAGDLVRLVVVDGRVRVGVRASSPGRGASIHPRAVCVTRAAASQAFSRAFRQPLPGYTWERGRPAPGGTTKDGGAVVALIEEIESAYVSQQSRIK